MDNSLNNSNLIYKMLKGHTTRFLTNDDFGVYMDLLSNHDSFMGEKMSQDEKNLDLKLAQDAFYDPRNRIVGTFDPSGKLITVVSGYFYENFSHWYVYRVYQQTEQFSLTAAIKNYGLLFTTTKSLVDYAETLNMFSYYNKFSVKHQLGWEKGFYLMKHKLGWNMRYEYLWEDIYMPGDECRSMNHKFFFPRGKEVTTTPCVLTLVTMKQEERRELLMKRYNIDLGKDYLTT